MKECQYHEIQTSRDVWTKLLEINPITEQEIFFEPFAGDDTLYKQITNKKYWCEITRGRDIFDFDFNSHQDITTVYTNPPYKVQIPNKKGEMVVKNSVFFFLEYLIDNLTNLKKIGFLINAKSFNALTPHRLAKLEKKGFTMSNITLLNTNYWFGIYYFVLFEKEQTNKPIKYIEKTFTEKHTI